MNNSLFHPGIQSIEFFDRDVLFVHLTNDRICMVPLDKFPAIKDLSADEKKAFEIIDGSYLSFLAIDEIYSIEELIGLPEYPQVQNKEY